MRAYFHICSLVCMTIAGHVVGDEVQQGAPARGAFEGASITDGHEIQHRQPIEEIIVEGKRINDRIDPIAMGRIRNDNADGARLYRRGQYKEAYPYLLYAAQMGFKLAQARLSYIYQLQLKGMPRDPVAAIGWIGVAASPTTDPEIRNYYRRFVAHFPEVQRAAVDNIVAEYIDRYGSEAVGLFCSNDRMAGTHIAKLKCDFETEYDFRDILDDMSIEEGIATTGGSNGEE